jgi:sugar lactone lactonase YvrE
MTIDLDGNLWVAVWDAAEVRQYGPTGRLLCTVLLPVRRPTAVAFHRDILVITTARAGLPDPGNLDGMIFALRVPVGGSPSAAWAGQAPVAET